MASTIIPLSYSLDGRGYRLIELPSEVQALIEGSASPMFVKRQSLFSV